MSKKSTLDIQKHIQKLGVELGFVSEIECTLPTIRGQYTPRYDVVWFLNVSNFINPAAIDDLFRCSDPYLEYVKGLVPIAGFEIEGSTTTSKNQIGNLSNLAMFPGMFRFVVVDNAGASNENDTYRRGLKICRTFQASFGHMNIVFLDSFHIENLSGYKPSPPIFQKEGSGSARNVGSGGETKSIPIAKRAIEILQKSNLIVKHDYRPDIFRWMFAVNEDMQKCIDRRNLSNEEKRRFGFSTAKCPKSDDDMPIRNHTDYYYVPKLDIAAGFELPASFVDFLNDLASNLGDDMWNYPILYNIKQRSERTIFHPLVAVEVETSVSKHLNGGLMNMAFYSTTGLLVSERGGGNHLEMLRDNFGMKNLFFRDIESLMAV